MPATTRRRTSRKVAFVLGGGGQMGAYEVGMLRALLELGIRPDLVVGTSVGALNGAAIAASPTLETVGSLQTVWLGLERSDIFGGSIYASAANLVRTRTHIHSNRSLRRLIERTLQVSTFEELAVPFQCVAACIERAAEQWFDSGPLVDAILASAAVPGVLPAVLIGGEHFIDGGVVNSIPISRAVDLGATEIFVLHAGRVERPLEAPKNLWQVAWVAFEIARRHRFARDLATLPKGVVAHVLPTGESKSARYDDVSQLRYRDFKAARRKIEGAHRASAAYLEGISLAR